MELGNMVFGSSRGQAEIPREDKWHEPLSAVLDAAGCDSYGWTKFENATFMVQGYDWDAECDCGFDEVAEKWHEQHPHTSECYDSTMAATIRDYDARSGYAEIDRAVFGGDHSILGGMEVEESPLEIDGHIIGVGMIMTPRKDEAMDRWRKASDARHKFEDAERKKLCKARGLSYPNGCAVHCDCYKSAAANEWFGENDHASQCRLVQPNFLYKPTGFRANWYKYPLRDSYMTPPISLAEWKTIMAACESSLTPSN